MERGPVLEATGGAERRVDLTDAVVSARPSPIVRHHRCYVTAAIGAGFYE